MGCLINFDGDTMILTGNEDLRVQKTIDSINRTFEEMLIEMDYSQITVKELTERAKINKKHFIVIMNAWMICLPKSRK